MKQEFTVSALQRQRRRYRGSAGISQMNQRHGFGAAFRDAETGIIYDSCYADGRPAPVHLLDGLPEALVLARAVGGRVTVVKRTVVAGFVRNGRFYTRQEAVRSVTGEVESVISLGACDPLAVAGPPSRDEFDQRYDAISCGEIMECGWLALRVMAAALEIGWLALGLSWRLAYGSPTLGVTPVSRKVYGLEFKPGIG
ncbi:MAG: hypothetical protein ACREYF_09395, partial [Gammaproteobacteria bacterium]